MKIHTLRALLLVTTALGLQASPVFAQAAPASEPAPGQNAPQGSVGPVSANSGQSDAYAGIEDIVVTAQKRSENVQNVPIAVAAFSGAALQQKGVDNVAQLANLTPSVQLSSTSQFFSSPSMLSGFIRGIGQDDFAMNFEPGVGTYIDGVYLARTAGSNVDLLDVERLEILKGPQGTLFGRNTIGGAISVVTRTPKDEFGFTGQLTVGRFNRIDVGGVVDIPISDQLLTSIAFSSKNRDGWQKRIPFPGAGNFVTDAATAFNQVSYRADDRAGGIGEQSIRAKALWHATDRLDVTLSADYLHSSTSGSAGVILGTSQTSPAGPGGLSIAGLYNTCINTPSAVLTAIGLGAVCGPRTGAPSIAGVNADADPNNNRLPIDNRYATGSYNRSYATGVNFSKTVNYGFTGILDYDLGPASLKSITAYRKLDTRFGSDLDQSPVVGFEGSFRVNEKQFSEELQLSGKALDDRLTYLFGLYYFHETGTETERVIFPGGLIQIVLDSRFKTDSYAAFTNLNYRISDLIGITLGGRYTKEDKSLFGSQRDVNQLFPKAGLPAVLFPDPSDLTQFYPQGKQSQSFSNFTPKVGVELHPTQQIMVYGSYSKGFKSGGWTTRISGPLLVAPTFGEEQADTYEVGFKSQFFDRIVQINAAAFTTKYKDIQILLQRGISPSFENAGDARIKGVELEGVFAPSRAFRLNASVGYIDAHYTRLDPAAPFSINNALPKVPKWSVSVSPEYNLFLANDARITLRGDYTYKSSIAADAENTPELFSGKVGLVNASLSYAAPGDTWSLSIGGNNVFNKRYIANGVDQRGGAGYLFAVPNRPGEYYATLRMSF